MIYRTLSELIGRTPLFEPVHYNALRTPHARVLCKLESFNPTGSVKDRAALFMLTDAIERGVLCKGATVIEPTSGNTGIGLAALCASFGLRLILTMPESMSAERRALLAAYGAELVLTPAEEGMTGAVKRAKVLADELPGSFIPSQFENSANPRAHYETTGPEIWQDAEGRVDVFVAGVGTGGTLSGIARYLKGQNPHCRIVGVEPAASPLLSKGHAGTHGLQGIGANFVPQNYDGALVDEILTVTEEEACRSARELRNTEGLLVGITSGAALHAATLLAGRKELSGKTVVALLPDSGERYLSTSMFEEK